MADTDRCRGEMGCPCRDPVTGHHCTAPYHTVCYEFDRIVISCVFHGPGIVINFVSHRPICGSDKLGFS